MKPTSKPLHTRVFGHWNHNQSVIMERLCWTNHRSWSAGVCGEGAIHLVRTHRRGRVGGSSAVRIPMYCCHSDVIIYAHKGRGWVWNPEIYAYVLNEWPLTTAGLRQMLVAGASVIAREHGSTLDMALSHVKYDGWKCSNSTFLSKQLFEACECIILPKEITQIDNAQSIIHHRGHHRVYRQTHMWKKSTNHSRLSISFAVTLINLYTL